MSIFNVIVDFEPYLGSGSNVGCAKIIFVIADKKNGTSFSEIELNGIELNMANNIASRLSEIMVLIHKAALNSIEDTIDWVSAE